MKKTFLKKALTFISAAVMAGAVGLGAGLNVHAADGDVATPPADPSNMTTVTLTKLAVQAPATVGEHGLYEQADLAKGDVVPNAGFDVYDVTDAYWDRVKAGDPTDSASLNQTKTDETTGEATTTNAVFTDLGDKFKSGTTNENGQIDFSLPNYNDANQYKVYLFRETSAPKGYTYSPDFVMSLPAKDKDGDPINHAYVYPKDAVTGSYQLKFTKVDTNHHATTLEGAAFIIKNDKLGKFAQVEGYVGADQPLPGFNTNQVTVKWVEESKATYFTSDKGTGLFGFAAASQKTNNGDVYGLDEDTTYTIKEMTAPKGYKTDAAILNDTDLTVQTGTTKEPNEFTVTDTPEGILPHTGGAGIIAIVAVGLVMTVVGVVAYNKRRVNA